MASELAKHVERNWTSITGWTPDGMDEEVIRHPEIDGLCREFNVDAGMFLEEFSKLRSEGWNADA